MTCPTCDNEMRIEEGVMDFSDPSVPDGHGQCKTKAWVCLCGATMDFEPGDAVGWEGE